MLQARKVAGSNPDVIGFLSVYLTLPGRAMSLGFTQPLTKMGTKRYNISGGKE
jgi:hypothetical protein